jgi:hypothetical protein
MDESKAEALITAVQEWASDCEGHPCHPADARLMQALWRYEGDQPKACPECDGECGEPCAPCTADQACASLDRWIADWRKRHGVTDQSDD